MSPKEQNNFSVANSKEIRFKEIEIISVFCENNSMKLEVNNRKKTGKIYKYVEIKQPISE